MNKIQKIKQDSIEEFGSEKTQAKYQEIAKRGLWDSEKILIDKFFKPGTKILDIGCGSGRTTIILNKKGYDVVGVDITKEMIKTAREIAEKNNLNIKYQVGDATALEFGDNEFDGAIFANNGWGQIPDKNIRQKALKEIYRVLKPGGHFILTAHQRYYSVYYVFYWLYKCLKFKIFKFFKIDMEELDFGDIFFKRYYKENNKRQRQFMHITNGKEVKEQIMKAGFKIVLNKPMGDISKEDAKKMYGALSKNFKSYKSPVFYVCRKANQ